MKTYNEDFKLRVVQQKNAGKTVPELCDEFDYAITIIGFLLIE